MEFTTLKPRCEISVLVVSPRDHSEPICNSLNQENLKKGRSYKLVLHNCETVEDVPSFHTNFAVDDSSKNFKYDYIMLVMDCRRRYCVQRAEEEIAQIPNYYFSTSRIFFVILSTTMENYTVWSLQRKYKCPVLAGDFLVPDGFNNLAKRIINLVEFFAGTKTGIPVIGNLFQDANEMEHSNVMEVEDG